MLHVSLTTSFSSALASFCDHIACVLSHFGRVQLFATLWTVTHQTPLSLEFSRQECWSGLSSLPPGDFSNPETEPASPEAPALQADSLLLSP